MSLNYVGSAQNIAEWFVNKEFATAKFDAEDYSESWDLLNVEFKFEFYEKSYILKIQFIPESEKILIDLKGGENYHLIYTYAELQEHLLEEEEEEW